VGLGLTILPYGMVFHAWPVAILGAVVTVASLFGWAIEPSAEPHDDHDDHHDAGAAAIAGAH
jgi:hypothetical protein